MTPARGDDTALLALAERARASLPPAVNGRIEKAVRLVQSDSVDLHDDGTAIVLSESDGVTPYRVVGKSCACPDYTFQAPQGWCAHRIAVAMVQRLTHNAADGGTADVQEASAASGSTCEPSGRLDTTLTPPTTSAAIPAEYVVTIQGKPFVRFAGLLKMAHERGLTSLTETWTYNDPELSLAHAVASFQDGKHFEGSGDATPANVTRKVAPHFRRVALTRAKSRALRDALDIDMVAYEELGEE
jgi:hypothetical protein